MNRKGITILSPGELEIREYPIPEIASDEVLVQTKACALCTIEQRLYRGILKDYPAVPGHEGAGVAVAVGDRVRTIAVGDHVLPGRNSCHVCVNCINGEGACLTLQRERENQKVAPGEVKRIGSLATYTIHKETALTKIHQSVPFVKACLAEPLSDVIRSITRSRLTWGETCVIIGAGIMGCLHVQLAKKKGAKVIVSEPDVYRREMALKAGADIVFSPEEEDPAEFVRNETGGVGANVVFNTVAISSVYEQAFAIVAALGRIVGYSNQHPDTPVPVKMGWLHSKQIEIIGTIDSTQKDFYLAARLIEQNLVNVEMLTDSIFSFEQCREAFEKAIVPRTYRVVIVMD